jgi:PAS domain S-box-containing protein
VPGHEPISDQQSISQLLLDASQDVVLAVNEQEISLAMVKCLQAFDVITCLAIVEVDNLQVISINDPDSQEIVPLENYKLHSFDINIFVQNQDFLIYSDPISAPSTLTDLLIPLWTRGAKSAAIIPIQSSRILIGLIILASRIEGVFSPGKLTPFSKWADIAAKSISRLRDIKKNQTRLDGLHHSLDAALNIFFETDLEPLYESIYSQIQQLFGQVDFLIAIYHQEKNTIEIAFAFEKGVRINIDPFPLGEGLTSILIKTRKPLLFAVDAENQTRLSGAKIVGLPAKSWMGVPLILADQVIGAMIVEDVVHEQRFTEDDLDFLLTLSPQIAAAIRNAQLVTEIRKSLKAFDEEKYLLSTLLETINDKVFFKDGNSRFIRANRALINSYGQDNLQELVGKSDFDFLSYDQAAQAYNEDQGIILSGKKIEDKIERITRPGQEEIWTISTKAPLKSPDGRPMGVLGISKDVTELVKVRETAQKRAQQLQTSAEIARDVSSSLQPDELLTRVVNLVRNRFGFYHSSVFLLDNAGENALLRESTGEAGRQMKLIGHKLGVGSKSIVGQVTANGKALVINDVSIDSTHLPNPLLPDTRAELAIPLKTPRRILGALDVQSDRVNAFSDEDVNILETLADQLSIAIVNSELYAESQRAITQHRLLHQITNEAAATTNIPEALTSVIQGVLSIFNSCRTCIYLLDASTTTLTAMCWGGYPNESVTDSVKTDIGEGIAGIAARDRQTIYQGDIKISENKVNLEIRSELAIPLILRTEVLGVLKLESPLPYAFTETDQEILATLASSIAVDITNIRLFEQVMHQVERSQQLFETANKIRRSANLKTILETSAIEIGKLLSAQQTCVSIFPNSNGQGGSSFTYESDHPAEIVKDKQTLHIPLTLRDSVIGQINIMVDNVAFSPEEMIFIDTLAAQTAQALENARLLEELHQKVERERTISSITAKIRATTDINSIMRTTVQELSQAISASTTVIRLQSNHESDAEP